ncbi:MAG: endonuclease [Salinivirgaceae bacterium]|nr:endonuclease [Salinivirgaceae bacterium]
MKNLLTLAFSVALVLSMNAQPVGDYNGTEGKTGDELKAALHNIIKDHVAMDYSYAKNVFALSDRDPNNSENVILLYTGRSTIWNYYGTGGDFINREHVWAKSHGNFGEAKPTGSDYHNLRPADGSVNVARSNKDFDICQGVAGAQQHSEATECYFTSNAWEPRDAVKGDVARIIFYMSTRYEGGSGEPDLEVVDELDTYPQPEHGKLSALYLWNGVDNPDAFEQNRNNVVYSFQKNRNPYIDNPNWVKMIWGDMAADPIAIGNMEQSIEIVTPSDAVAISATAIGSGAITATLKWGLSYTELTNSIEMNLAAGEYSATIPAQAANARVFVQVEATNGTATSSSVVYNYLVQPVFAGTITPIIEAQGETADSPLADQIISVTGVVTGNFGQGYYIQDAAQAWSGLYIYDLGRNPEIGDSVIVTGKLVEYYNLTELTEISMFKLVSKNNPLPEPIVITTGAEKEPYESVYVKIANGQVTSINEGFGLWKINDGSGPLMVHNTVIHSHIPELAEYYSVTGPLTYDFSEWKIELRSADDIQAGLDTEKPIIVELNQTSSEYIWIYFNEAIKIDDVDNLENYSFNTSVDVLSANRHAIQTHIILLRVTNMSMGMHALTVSNIQDLSGNIMEPQTISFFSEYTLIDEVVEGEIKLYPNPAITGVINLDNTRNVVSVDIFDFSGRLVHHLDNMDRLQKIVVGGLPQGVLSVLMKTDNGKVITKQIVVQ